MNIILSFYAINTIHDTIWKMGLTILGHPYRGRLPTLVTSRSAEEVQGAVSQGAVSRAPLRCPFSQRDCRDAQQFGLAPRA